MLYVSAAAGTDLCRRQRLRSCSCHSCCRLYLIATIAVPPLLLSLPPLMLMLSSLPALHSQCRHRHSKRYGHHSRCHRHRHCRRCESHHHSSCCCCCRLVAVAFGCWRVATNSGGSGNGGSSLACYNIGDMGPIVLLECGVGNGGGGGVGGRCGWPHGSGHPPPARWFVMVAMMAELLLFWWWEYSSRNDVCVRAKISAASHRQATF